MRAWWVTQWWAAFAAFALLTFATHPPGIAQPNEADEASSHVAVRPVPGEVDEPFAPPSHRYGAGHRGVDLVAAPGEEVRGALGGIVAFAGQVAGGGWVTLDHGGGLQTTYGVLGALAVRAGETVAAGQVLGTVAEGRTHLDWGAKRDGSYVDPLDLLGRWRARLVHPDTLLAGLAPPSPAPGGEMTWPVAGAITSGLGVRTHPITGERRLHAGLDVSAPTGAAIAAAASGVVTFSGARGGYGLLVIVDHGNGLETRYAHASALHVRAGEAVGQGQIIARVGSTGLSTGPHLHFEVRQGGRPVDPLDWLPGRPEQRYHWVWSGSTTPGRFRVVGRISPHRQRHHSAHRAACGPRLQAREGRLPPLQLRRPGRARPNRDKKREHTTCRSCKCASSSRPACILDTRHGAGIRR